ncbi:1,2-phenylacetyl-CoA epoxidase subunit PaaC [Deinococcus ficus]|jgi:ring-1,2-phenylacetyl-CoA epoxidase subunit PaaC|uniref:Phenylacetate-CoA oxygenase subunit PaaI n=1 Tax=Deinococcus ficus TaxID=317577 RepID=A0A221SY20_9DEIO|nr:1,2-phenylacetyl-CoA epoxidase subunit PaaC [Deinococcus ficus]ASN81548.1 phenylacetate-CoA oxygenase subunit PaaI [Deinococcus ficus]GHF83678.1 phenylacetate-CoA oxygenase subunit PaaI [Deinococcus ficus]
MTSPSAPSRPALTADTLTDTQKRALITRLQALADDEIILAHRDSEWTGHAPILEEDIALANIAQDEIGHALMYLTLREQLDGQQADQLTFFRGPREYTNVQLVELPKGDWAFTMLRQYLYDAFEALYLDALRASTYAPLAEVANKAVREEKFHLQHTALWVERLGLGTEESRRRLQDALNTQWAYTAQLFQPTDGEAELIAAGITPDPAAVHARWDGLVRAHLDRSGLQVPAGDGHPFTRAQHSEALLYLLTEMQSTAREHADAQVW